MKAAVIVSGGFKEIGEEGREREEYVRRLAKEHGVRVIGPNCIGILAPESGVDTFFQSRERMDRPGRGSISILSQSGTYAASLTEWVAGYGMGVSKVVSYGNRVDVDEADLLEYFSDDPETDVVLIYVEGLEDGRKFLETLKRVSAKKPIIIYKGGKRGGARAAVSHTGWLAGDYKVFHSAMHQGGAIEVSSIYGLIDAAKALTMYKGYRIGRGVIGVTNGAGPVVVAYDLLEGFALHPAELSKETMERLVKNLPPICQVTNLVDLTGSADSSFFESALKVLVEAEEVGIILAVLVLQDTPLDEGIVDVLARYRERKPIFVCAGGGSYTRRICNLLEERGVPVYETAERAVEAASALARYSDVVERSRGKASTSASTLSKGWEGIRRN
jgi:acyl-CoA synthetase (NDP forming)